jgi:tetratricopeptide (TPR) repeat protein
MHDQFGNPISCENRAALAAYDRAVDAHIHGWPGALEAADAALEEAPDFALALALRALILAARLQREPARQALTLARAAPRLLPSERSHLDLITAAIEGRVRDALALLLVHARLYPTDVLALSTGLGAYGLFAFSGRADHDQARLQFLESLAPHHPENFAWLLAYRGWARIETGAVDEGLAMTRRALALRRTNAHNAHMVMHGLFETGEWQESVDFIDDWLKDYFDTALMWGHLHWHAALGEIELGRTDAALARLLGPMLAHLPLGLPFMGLADAPSLMWRLGLRDAAALPWSIVQQHAQQHFGKGSNPFGELHLAMIAAAHGDRAELDRSRSRLDAALQSGSEGAAPALQWVEGLIAMLEGDREAAQARLDACVEASARLGGSHAQRTILMQTRQALRVPKAAPA